MDVSTSVAPRQRPKGGQGGASAAGGIQLPTPIGRAKVVAGQQQQQATPGNRKSGQEAKLNSIRLPKKKKKKNPVLRVEGPVK